MIFIFQGYFTIPKGALDVLNTFKTLPKYKHIVFLGNGPLMDEIIRESKNHSNIHHHPMVSTMELLTYTEDADVGIALVQNTSLSYYYISPNKLFEYLIAGIPIIATNFPEMRKVVNETKSGWLIEPGRKNLFDLINEMTKDEIRAKKNELE